jgi:hypothetical protein
MWFCRPGIQMWCCCAGIHTVMMQYKVIQCGTAVQTSPTSNISNLTLFSTFARHLFLQPTFRQPHSHRSSGHIGTMHDTHARSSCQSDITYRNLIMHYSDDVMYMIQMTGWFWRSVNIIITSTYYLSKKHITTPQRNTEFGFSPKSSSVSNEQTWHLLICGVIHRALKYFANFTYKKINSVTGSLWVHEGTNHLQRAVSCQLCAFNCPQHGALVPNEDNRLHKHDPQKVRCK